MVVCQCPERGDLHFYNSDETTEPNVQVGVNALKGATFISTVTGLTVMELSINFVSMP